MQTPRKLTQRERWLNRVTWLEGCDIQTELQQAQDEGRQLAGIEEEILRLLAVPKPDKSWFLHLGEGRDEAWLAEAARLMDVIQTLPFLPDYPYIEPNSLEEIQAARPASQTQIPVYPLKPEQLLEHLHGGVLGRFCGCLLGRPLEGSDRRSIRIWAEATDNWPIQNYMARPTEAQAAVINKQEPAHQPNLSYPGEYAGEINGMVGDDDVNYTVIGFDIIRTFGPDFTSDDVGFYWLSHLPLTHTCTAERIAYRNLAMSILPPHTATVRNPYREWIGAQIRADYYGYANPGNPERAAAQAWRDASLSHVRNGIYGSMFVAAMIAAAYSLTDWSAIVQAGLEQIPEKCRLANDVRKILDLHQRGLSYAEVVDAIHAQWDETDHHTWCHTNSNAQVVVMALLWGEDDYELTITRAVMAGFDTDCNAATSGSLWGVKNGVNRIPAKWADPLDNRGVSSIPDWQTYKIDALSRAMVETAIKNQAPVGTP